LTTASKSNSDPTQSIVHRRWLLLTAGSLNITYTVLGILILGFLIDRFDDPRWGYWHGMEWESMSPVLTFAYIIGNPVFWVFFYIHSWGFLASSCFRRLKSKTWVRRYNLAFYLGVIATGMPLLATILETQEFEGVMFILGFLSVPVCPIVIGGISHRFARKGNL
jgi:hypothetical protein